MVKVGKTALLSRLGPIIYSDKLVRLYYSVAQVLLYVVKVGKTALLSRLGPLIYGDKLVRQYYSVVKVLLYIVKS